MYVCVCVCMRAAECMRLFEVGDGITMEKVCVFVCVCVYVVL